MTHAFTDPEAYLASLPPERQPALRRLVDIARRRLLPACQEVTAYVGINYEVPLATYPPGYHCTPGEPLPYVTLASQARHIALYHMGIYADPALLAWFTEAYAQAGVGRLDMGKSCIRWARADRIPFALVDELLSRQSVDAYVALYTASRAQEAQRQAERKASRKSAGS